ncbi:MAG: hypothetical protein RI566_10435 [Sediminimonas sp.]|uniref:hypothetical protein n=1 Tax=Sediminimonas sp. TaxID=2823379 RepID=UPI002870591E|nr:hypothetical protein [Sediminimonas sp.]MDR9485578.1 hypothetical protein [Sediminimonas sp.]
MEILIWAGAAVSVAGLLGLFWCIIKVMRARHARLSDEELRAVVQSVLPVNMAALLFSVLGLMMVVVGIFLS